MHGELINFHKFFKCRTLLESVMLITYIFFTYFNTLEKLHQLIFCSVLFYSINSIQFYSILFENLATLHGILCSFLPCTMVLNMLFWYHAILGITLDYHIIPWFKCTILLPSLYHSAATLLFELHLNADVRETFSIMVY